jgi:hypothetical protein
MSAAATRNSDSTVTLLVDRDLLALDTPPLPPVRFVRSSAAQPKQGIRAATSARESGVIHFRAACSDPSDVAANGPPEPGAEQSDVLDTKMLPRELVAPASARRAADRWADIMNTALLVMAIAVLSAVASVLVHLSAVQ